VKGLASDPSVQDMVRRALDEDIGTGDVTTLALVPETLTGTAVILSRGNYIVAGIDVAIAAFQMVDRTIRCQPGTSDGSAVGVDETILAVSGRVRGILTAERTALNFLQRMTGIATRTRQFVERAKPYATKILDTRKTTPTLRILEKYAVACGGGTNHRMGLYDMVLIKDNHRRLWQAGGLSSLADAVAAARKTFPGVPVEVEVESVEDMEDALAAKPEWIMLDNMTPDAMHRCVRQCSGRCKLEASGGVTLDTVHAMAATGVDAISIGGLTHSAPAADLSLELQ
jgi:nicotinate-nucleotide pyrophosphorylase (carboxylating)